MKPIIFCIFITYAMTSISIVYLINIIDVFKKYKIERRQVRITLRVIAMLLSPILVILGAIYMVFDITKTLLVDFKETLLK